MARWHVVASYRTGNGARHIEHNIEELEQLQDLIEDGPDWRALEGIHITYTGWPEKLTEAEFEDEPVVQTVTAEAR